jgi:hypothetical protein
MKRGEREVETKPPECKASEVAEVMMRLDGCINPQDRKYARKDEEREQHAKGE